MVARRETHRTSTTRSPSWFVRAYFTLFGVGLLVGLVIAIIWIIAGVLHFHPLW